MSQGRHINNNLHLDFFIKRGIGSYIEINNYFLIVALVGGVDI
jgi:hypothetical protein